MPIRSLLLLLCGAACRDVAAPRVTAGLPATLPMHLAQLALVQDVALVQVSTAPAATSTMASLIGHEAFGVDIEGLRRSIVGQFSPGKVRVTFRMRVRSRLDRAVFVAPTFPVPPDTGNALFVFLVQAVALDARGAVSSAGPNEILVTVPGHGSVAPSPDWDGSWYDYLRSGRCVPGGSTCARYERFPAPVVPGGVSPWDTVGFDIDPTVRHIRMRLLLAADLANAS